MELLDDAIHRFTVEDVVRMHEHDIITDEDRVELVDGILYTLSPPGPLHSSTVARLTRHFAGALVAGRADLRVQDTLMVDAGFLSPDFLVLDEFRRDQVPSSAVLAVEVSVTTLTRDRRKVALFARAGVAEYWIAEGPTRTLVVHKGLRDGQYTSVARHGDGEQVSAPVGAPDVDVTALFG